MSKRIAVAVIALTAIAAAGVMAAREAQRGVAPVQSAAPRPAAPAAPGTVPPATNVAAAAGQAYFDDAGFHLVAEAERLDPTERAGREIWYKATAGNDRFHTYVFQQRVGVQIDWFRVLRSDRRDARFKTWGLINDPDCCTPGSPNCPARSLEQTFGLDYCAGDDELLKYVGRSGYRDPACDFKDGPVAAHDPHGPNDQRQSACDLAFGTSAGALGYRKFPNPRFDPGRWKALNGGQPGTWEGYDRKLTADRASSDHDVSHLTDGSVEPPFLVGVACGSCHIAFDPLNPPKDPTHPAWENLKGAIGNQYLRISQIMVSGMPVNSLEWQVFTHARPGTSDTSAVPTDQVNNPGTMNAIIHTRQRPTFAGEQVVKWRKTNGCATGEGEDKCWCEPGHQGKCWVRSTQIETVNHILKGGEDSIGALEAIQRVYFNIGSCSEQCWVNHLTDLRQVDPAMRNFGQTPFDIGQCRRDCANFRAIEDRLPEILAFLNSGETNATDLQVARANERKAHNSQGRYGYDDLVSDLDREFGRGAVARGRTVFAENCARCHSSLPESEAGPFAGRDFRAVDAKTGLRADWMGNDQSTPVSEVGTFRCRALHSNHMTGHIWDQFGSETLRARKADANLKEPNDGGRGYYRNISLLSVWAHAPFLHNNAMGPEICGGSGPEVTDFYRPSYVDASGQLLPAAQQPACWPYDPSVEGRFKLYKESMRQLLNPALRTPKITKLAEDIVIPVGPRLWDGKEEKELFGFTLVVPAGATAGTLGNLQHKQFVNDLVLAKLKPGALEAARGKAVADEMKQVLAQIIADPAKIVETVGSHKRLLEVYSSCTDVIENEGHTFGESLAESDKNALTAFLATL
ncbi:MAG: cytochrome c [Betaproteobacteria bacterium]